MAGLQLSLAVVHVRSKDVGWQCRTDPDRGPAAASRRGCVGHSNEPQPPIGQAVSVGRHADRRGKKKSRIEDPGVKIRA